MQLLWDFFSSIVMIIPNILMALLLLVLAFVAANLVRSLVLKVLKAINAEKYLAKVGIKDISTENTVSFIGKLAYFVTFLLFLPAVLDKLGMQSVSAPITGMVNSFLAFIPNLIAAGIIVAIGLFIANTVKQLLVPVLKALKVDSLQKEAGIEASGTTSLSAIIANVVYAVIILVVITSALDKLGIPAISAPANAVVASIFAMIPNVLGALLVIAVGIFVAQLVEKVLTAILAGVGADTLVEKIVKEPCQKVQLSKLIGSVVKYVLITIFLVQGINLLNLPVLTEIGAAIIAYMPAVICAVLILAVAAFAANTAEASITKKYPEAKAAALASKIAIYVLAVFMCLSQLHVATTIVETAFILVVAAFAVAFALAFGLGGRQAASNILAKLENKMKDNK